MKKILLLSFVLGTLSTIANPPVSKAPTVKSAEILDANTIIINNNDDMEINITADNQDIHISGNNNTINIEGTCKKILITGKGNDVNVDSVNEILIKGNYNFISWIKSENAGGKAKITDQGGYNNVGQRTSNAQGK